MGEDVRGLEVGTEREIPDTTEERELQQKRAREVLPGERSGLDVLGCIWPVRITGETSTGGERYFGSAGFGCQKKPGYFPGRKS